MKNKNSTPLFVGLTRPATQLGLPFTFLLVVMFAGIMIFMFTKSLFISIPAAVVLYMVSWTLAQNDMRFVELVGSRLQFGGEQFGKDFWSKSYRQ